MKNIQIVSISVGLVPLLGVLAQHGFEGDPLYLSGETYSSATDLCDFVSCRCKFIDKIPKCVDKNGTVYCPQPFHERDVFDAPEVCDSDNKTMFNKTGFELAVESCTKNKSIPIGKTGKDCFQAATGFTYYGPCFYTYRMGCKRCRLRDGVPKCVDETGKEYCPDRPGPPDGLGYCASNGKHYPSLKQMVIGSCESNTPLKIAAPDPVCQRMLDEQRQRLADEAEMEKKCYACRWTVRKLSNLPKMAATISHDPCGYYCKDAAEPSDEENYRMNMSSHYYYQPEMDMHYHSGI